MEDIPPSDEEVRAGNLRHSWSVLSRLGGNHGAVNPVYYHPKAYNILPYLKKQDITASNVCYEALLRDGGLQQTERHGRPSFQIGGLKYDKDVYITIIPRRMHVFLLICMLLGIACLAGLAYCAYGFALTGEKPFKDGIIACCVLGPCLSLTTWAINILNLDKTDVNIPPKGLNQLYAYWETVRSATVQLGLRRTETHTESKTNSGGRSSTSQTVIDMDEYIPFTVASVVDCSPDISQPGIIPLEVEEAMGKALAKGKLVQIITDIVVITTDQTSRNILESWIRQAQVLSLNVPHRTMDVRIEAFLPGSEYCRSQVYARDQTAQQPSALSCKSSAAFHLCGLSCFAWCQRIVLDNEVLRIKLPVVKHVTLTAATTPIPGRQSSANEPFPLPPRPLY